MKSLIIIYLNDRVTDVKHFLSVGLCDLSDQSESSRSRQETLKETQEEEQSSNETQENLTAQELLMKSS